MSTETIDVSLEIQPYPGLRPFREDETHLYFGREQHRVELLKRLAATHFVAVIGTSGSGKSSLVRAGLLPDLLSGYLVGTGSDWVVVESRPGADPLGRLATAFSDAGWTTDANALRTNSSRILDLAGQHLTSGQHLLVLLDQFEELFRLKVSEEPAEDADEKAAFVRLLLNTGGQRTDVSAGHPAVHVVMAMRSEFLGRASVYRGLPEAIDQGQYLIPRLSREQLRKAIEAPARVAGGELEEALVQRLLNELGDNQDQLPVLQHALMRCWQLRTGADRIGIDAYDRSGQLANALSLDANDALDEARKTLGARGEPIVQRVFQALRETDVNGGQTRRPTTIVELSMLAECAIAQLIAALAPFRKRSFVLPPPETSLEGSTLIDISHEALLRRWDMLRRWIEDDDLDRTRYLRLATRAEEEEGSERPQYLVPPLLDLLVKFWADRNPPKMWAIRHHKGYEQAKAFLDRSEKYRRALELEQTNRQAEETRQKQALADALVNRRRTRQLVIVGLAFASLLLAVVGFAWWNARKQGVRLEGLLLGAKATSIPRGNVEARLQLVAEAARRRQDLESWQELLKTLLIAPKPLFNTAKQTNGMFGLGKKVESVAITPNDQWLYAAANGLLHLIDLSSGQQRVSMPLSAYPGKGDQPFLLVSGDKLVMLRASFVAVIDGKTLELLAEPPIPDTSAFTVSTDGEHAAFLGADIVSLCDLRTNCQSHPPHPIKGFSETDDLELSADGKILVVIGRSGEKRQLALFSTETWGERKVRLLDDFESLNMRVDENHVYVCTPKSLRQYDAAYNTLDERVVVEFEHRVERCRFFDNRTVTSHVDGAIRVWSEDGTLLMEVQGKAKSARGIALGDHTLAVANNDLQAWDILPYGRQTGAVKPQGFVQGSGSAYGEGALMALDSGVVSVGPQLVFAGRQPIAIGRSLGLAVYPGILNRSSPTLQLVVATLRPGKTPVRRWDYEIESRIGFANVTISPDERHVAIVNEEKKSVVILNATNGKPVKEVLGKSSVFFAPEGEFLALDEKSVVIYSLNDDKKRQWPAGEALSGGIHAVTFSPDGRLLAVAEPKEANDVVKVFEWPSLKSLGELPHTAGVIGLSFKADGQSLLTVTGDGTTHVWNLSRKEETFRIPPVGRVGLTASVTWAVFTPSGRIAILDDRGLTVISSIPDDLIEAACSRITSNLNPKQWQQFLGPEILHVRTCQKLPEAAADLSR